ncbi:MAG: TIGR03943 family protein [Actinomycetota bacterium]|nr:TIGR03943 family protein [Actinomycetota bacterium]
MDRALDTRLERPAERVHRTGLSPARVASALALSSWAGLFWFLIGSGRTSLYLSSRTDWVVPVGAIVLTAALAGRLLSLRTAGPPEALTRREALAIGVTILPVVTVLALPPASLGSFAADRRSSLASAGFSGDAGDISSGEVSLVDVASALRSGEGMQQLTTRAGAEVGFVGFVTRDPGMPADEFLLTRFLVSCCAADALSVQVRIVGAPPGRFEADQWVRAEGRLYPLGGEVIVDATDVVGVPRPARPYLNS